MKKMTVGGVFVEVGNDSLSNGQVKCGTAALTAAVPHSGSAAPGCGSAALPGPAKM